MSKIYVLIIACLLTAFGVKAQSGKVTGKVLNEKNEPLAGVTVKVDGSQGGTSTNVEGRFTLTVSSGKKYTITFSAVGYAAKTIDEVEVAAGKLTELDITLATSKKDLGTVTVTASRSNARKESTVSLIQFQKNTNTVAAVVSAEAIRRSPDKNTGEVLKRVPGTSVQEGKYLVVRGLSDRYNQAMLNGILLSSTEPDRKTFSFDIFPSTVIDNIIINKAFVPEYPGEWAGGLVQVNTKEIPAQNFFNIQVGTGFNTNVIGNDFYKYKGSNLDWLGFDNKTRALPDGLPTKSKFANLSDQDKSQLAAHFPNNWAVNTTGFQPNASLQASGGLTGNIFGKKAGATLAVTYNRTLKRNKFDNAFFSINGDQATPDFLYHTERYSEEVLLGAMANFSIYLNNNHKISVKNLFNVNSNNYTSIRSGYEYLTVNDSIKAKELAMRTAIFYNTQILGEHNMPGLGLKFNWFGSFNILDQYVPAQRRSEYLMNDATGLYEARISTGQSQKAGSIFYGNLSDYIYTAGGDLTKTFELFGNKQTVKGGYFFQVKDRLYDSRPFFVKLYDNSLKTLPEEQLFAAENFTSGKLALDEFAGNQYRYLANSILNAGYIQFDNSFTKDLRVVWGVRVENFDQLVGSVKQSDSRHIHTEVRDFLPALNITYKLTPTTNIRLSGSQTVIRPEFRELSNFAFYDFELGATVLGSATLKRTKVSNADLRYEIYPRAGELFTLGVFYKYFDSPIELAFNQSGAGSSNTFNYQNANNAKGYGVEFEMRKKLDFVEALKNLTLTTNLSYIHNRVEFGNKSLDRPMQGQSPYIINAGLQYDVEKLGLTSTLLYNQIGRRIAYVGNEQVPAIWEAPRPLLDFQIGKKIIKEKGELKLNVSDILNQKARFYHDLNDDGKYTKSKDALAVQRIYGTTFSLTFGYNF
ncbi:outer membrane beta-barrel protein [Niastella sp. OAS944]|uniref:TonB-dependent receptor n=1 Tax=Niastella sp. OAS944 TaxID=2664089 RepID=UPI003477ABE4|nr:outer membrane receptor for ferrienterochelin and colicin [Chitinophagaceae bacterium OAS944]